jgi:hypothetical protein
LPNLFGTPQRREIQETLPKLARGSSSSGVQDESPAAPAGDKTTLESPKTTLKSPENNPGTMSRVAFWTLQGLMFASLVAAVETTQRCLNAGSCTAIPVPFQSRTALYNLGVPVSVGIAVISYEMKKHGNHWWYVPPVITIAADCLLAIHGVRASQ